MVKPPNGFAHLGIIVLVVLAVLAIGFAGWKVYGKVKVTDEKPVSQVSSKAKEPERETAKADMKADDTANWLTFSNNEIGVAFKYPEEWKVNEVLPCVFNPSSATGQECAVNVVYAKSTNKYPPTISIERLATNLIKVEDFYDEYYGQSPLNNVAKDNIQVKGKPAIRYFVTNSGYLSKLYLIQSKDKVYAISTVDSHEAHQLKEYMPMFDKIFDSFEVTN